MEEVKILVASALVLVTSLAWNEAVRNFFAQQKALTRHGPWAYAVLVTAICIGILTVMNVGKGEEEGLLAVGRLKDTHAAGDATICLSLGGWSPQPNGRYALYYESESRFVGFIEAIDASTCTFDASALIGVDLEQGRYVWIKSAPTVKKKEKSIRRYMR